MSEATPSKFGDKPLLINNAYRLALRAATQGKDFQPRLTTSMYGTIVSFSYFKDFMVDNKKTLPEDAKFYIIPLQTFLYKVLRDMETETSDDTLSPKKYVLNTSYKDKPYSYAVTREGGLWGIRIGNEDPNSLTECPLFVLSFDEATSMEIDGTPLEVDKLSGVYAQGYIRAFIEYLNVMPNMIDNQQLVEYVKPSPDIM